VTATAPGQYRVVDEGVEDGYDQKTDGEQTVVEVLKTALEFAAQK